MTKKEMAAVAVVLGVGVSCLAGDLPRVWMSVPGQPEPFEQVVAMCRTQGVDVVEVPTRDAETCARQLVALRRHGMRGFTSSGCNPTEDTRDWVLGRRPYERAVFNGGAYRGLAIDRHLFSFAAGPHVIVIEPPVYSAVQCYTGANGSKSGHYFGASFQPVGKAEVIVPEKPFDGRAHVRIIECDVEPVEPGAKVEGDTVTPEMKGPEIDSRRLVRLRFDLTSCRGLMLDKVGLAVYWARDPESKAWKRGEGQLSVFAASTRENCRIWGAWRMEQWKIANGGTFPSDDIVGIRYGDECFNLTGHLNSDACSYPLWGFSESGCREFARMAPAGTVQPRTWGYPEIYGSTAYGVMQYAFHRACALTARAYAEGVHSVAPDVKVFRNTTRGDVWSEMNDHDGSGQELLTRELDLVHIDPYPVAKDYNRETIPFDMGYVSGLARRYGKPLMPWLQAHAYVPCGLRDVTAEDMRRMWEQHRAFAPDAIMWLGFERASKGQTAMTFPDRVPEAWAYAKDLHAEIHAAGDLPRPEARLAVLRPYATRAVCCRRKGGWANPADRLLRAYVEAWSVDHGLAYDVFEIPPVEPASERRARDRDLAKYRHVISTMPYPCARVIGGGTQGRMMSEAEVKAARKDFAAEIAKGRDGVRISVDVSRPTGPVKPVNAVGQPPLLGRRNHSLFHYLAEAGIPYSRLHDTGGYQGANVFVDIPNVFRNFDADEDDPANYDFAFTDDLLAGLVKHGVEPFYRLGVTIENDARFKSYRLDPPKDFAKWARICEHVIRHYTEGWANGFEYKMTYWEIWNEPDDFVNANENMMWRGTFAQYMELYEVTARHLKAKFPHLRIGGYGSCGFCGYEALRRTGKANPRHLYFYECATNFLAHAKAGGWPLDFFSFHSYSSVREQMEQVRLCRETLDRHGFRDVPINLDEWLPSQPNHDRVGTAQQASEIAAELIGLQKGPCDMAMIYDARCGVGCYSPLFNPLTYKPHKAYYAFTAFNELKKLGMTVATSGDTESVWSLAAAKDGRTAVLVANFGDKDVPFSLDMGGVPADCRLTDATRTEAKVPVPRFLPAHSFLLVRSGF